MSATSASIRRLPGADGAQLCSTLTDFANGAPVVLVGDCVPEAPARLIIAAELVTTETMAFVVRHTSGFVSVALPAARCNALDLPRVANDRMLVGRPIAAVSVDAMIGISTGISAADRSHTARLLADPTTVPGDFSRPGHVVPVRVPLRIGVIVDAEAAALALCTLSGVAEAAVCSDLVHDAGHVMSSAEVAAFGAQWNINSVSIAQLSVLAGAGLADQGIA